MSTTRRGHAPTPERIAAIRALADAGHTQLEIMHRLKCARDTILKYAPNVVRDKHPSTPLAPQGLYVRGTPEYIVWYKAMNPITNRDDK